MNTKLLIIIGIVIVSAVTALSFVNNSEDTKNPNECWYQEDNGELKPCVTDTVGLPLPQEGFCDETNNGPFCVDRNFFESQYVRGGSINLDPDLSPGYALDFTGSLFYYTFLPIFGIILLLFLAPYFILKRKKIPRRPYMSVISAAIMLFFGIPFLVNGLGIVTLLMQEERIHSLDFIATLTAMASFGFILVFSGMIILLKSKLIRNLLGRVDE